MSTFRHVRTHKSVLCLSLTILLALSGPPVSGKTTETGSGLLLAVNQGEAALSIFDPRAGTELARVLEGDITGHEVAASVDGKFAYVPIYGNSSVGEAGSDGQELVAIDIASRKVVRSERVCAEAGGIGFRNYWFKPIKVTVEKLPKTYKQVASKK